MLGSANPCNRSVSYCGVWRQGSWSACLVVQIHATGLSVTEVCDISVSWIACSLVDCYGNDSSVTSPCNRSVSY